MSQETNALKKQFSTEANKVQTAINSVPKVIEELQKKVDGVFSEASKKITSLTGDLNKVTDSFAGLSEKPQEILDKVILAEQEMNEKLADFKNKEEEAKIELSLKVKANADGVLQTLAKERKLELVPADELSNLKKSAEVNEKALDVAVEEAIRDTTDSLNQKFDNEKALIQAQNATKEAENVAKIQSLQAQLKSTQDENGRLVEMLNKQTEVELARAKSSSVTINQTK
jgi:hypothetical protein